MDTNSNTPKSRVIKTLYICHFSLNNLVPRAFVHVSIYSKDASNKEVYHSNAVEFKAITRASAARLEAFSYAKRHMVESVAFQVQTNGLVIVLEHHTANR